MCAYSPTYRLWSAVVTISFLLALGGFAEALSPERISERWKASAEKDPEGVIVEDLGAGDFYDCPLPVHLTSGLVVPSPYPRAYFAFVQPTGHWTAVGVRQTEADWDIACYRLGAGNPPPTCFSSTLALSQLVGVVDFIVADFNHATPDTCFVRTYRYSGLGDATAEWDDGADILSLGSEPIQRATGPGDILEVWDVFLEAGGRYVFSLQTSGDAESNLCLFRNPTDGEYWVGRSQAVLESDRTATYRANRSDWHAIAIVNDNAGTGDFLVAADTCAAPEPSALAAGTAVFTPSPGAHFSFDQEEPYWAAIGVRSADPEWELELHGADCYRDLLAGSASPSPVEIIAADFNHAALGTFYCRATQSAPGTDAATEWDAGADEILVGEPPVERMTGATDVLEVWDVTLEAGTTYEILFEPAGAAALRLLLFRSEGTSYFAHRGQAIVDSSQSVVFTPPVSDRYGLCVVNENGESGSYRVAVNVTVDVAAMSPAAIEELRVSGPSPSSAPVSLEFHLARSAQVSFTITNVAGRLAGAIAARSAPAGTGRAVWDGRSPDGRPLPSGVYWAGMWVDGRKAGHERIVLLD